MNEIELGGIRCSEVLSLLDRHVDGTLSEDELRLARTHVAGCENCARFGGAYARVVAALRGGVADGDELVPDVSQRLFARLGGLR